MSAPLGPAAPLDFAAWRAEARRLLALEVAPEQAFWGESELFAAPAGASARGVPERAPAQRAAGAHHPSRVPRAFLALAEQVACHRSPARWPLLYRMLWRLTHGEPALLSVESDAEVAQARAMTQAVRRDAHKMKAFVRFREVRDTGDAPGQRALLPDEGVRYVAWHRPEHLIVEQVAPFFVERFRAMRWSILTPDLCVHWDGVRLTRTPGATRERAPADDALEELWRDYYASTFNPARTNLKLMTQHVPRHHWETLPELRDLHALLTRAPARVEEMLEHVTPARRSAAAYVPPGASSLRALNEAARGCQGCELYAKATQTVFGEGPPQARWALVGEQPGDQEDMQGRVFIGPAGEVLDRALAQADLPRASLYLTNAVKHFKWEPRGKKRLHQRPSAREMKACQPWLEAELALLRPELIVCLGATAAQSVLGPHAKVSELRGRLVPTPRAPACLVTWHPSAVLRAEDPAASEAIFAALVADLRLAARVLRGSPAGGAALDSDVGLV